MVVTFAIGVQAQDRGASSPPLRDVHLPGNFTTMPAPREKVAALYPPGSAVSGTVDVEIVVSNTGKVIDARVTKSLDAAADEVCRSAAERWTFTPAMERWSEPNRPPTPLTALVLLRFQLTAPRDGNRGTVSAKLTTVSDQTDVHEVHAAAITPGNDDGFRSPKIARQITPSYTDAAMRARIQGDVEMEAVILPDGTVGKVRVVKSLDAKLGLDDEALHAARHWLFVPATRDGEPIPVIVTLILSFRLH